MKKLMASGLAFAAALGTVGTAQAVSLTLTRPELSKAGGITNGTQLVNEILGTGITLVGTPVYKGATESITGTTSVRPHAAGIFKGGINAGIGIESGIILSTGYVKNAPGPNNSRSTDGVITENESGELGASGDTDLYKNFTAPTQTYDASVLDFQFKSTGTNLYVNFVFASEEYNEYVGSTFSDVFAFFLDQNHNNVFEANENIALVPHTNTPVSVNTVTAGRPTTTGTWISPSYPEYYNSNDPTDVNNPYGPNKGKTFDLEYDGFTDVFTARASGLTIGDTYRIKLAIADVGDRLIDSAVFIESGTFSTVPPGANSTPEPATIFLMGSGLAAARIASRRKKA